MALDGLEAVVYASVGPTIHARRKFKINVLRYADDFVVTGISKEVLEHGVLPAVRQFMATRGLALSEEKTRITHIAEGFDFLGQNVRKYANKLLIKPAKKSVKALMVKVREIVKKNESATQANLIKQVKCDLKADRTSASPFLANFARLLLTEGAYVLHQQLRHLGLQGTALATAQPRTVILSLFKIAVRVKQYKDRVLLHLPSACPVKVLLAQVCQRLYPASKGRAMLASP